MPSSMPSSQPSSLLFTMPNIYHHHSPAVYCQPCLVLCHHHSPAQPSSLSSAMPSSMPSSQPATSQLSAIIHA
eukprot:13865444-Ditylum_brightwellii.AAC.1